MHKYRQCKIGTVGSITSTSTRKRSSRRGGVLQQNVQRERERERAGERGLGTGARYLSGRITRRIEWRVGHCEVFCGADFTIYKPRGEVGETGRA